MRDFHTGNIQAQYTDADSLKLFLFGSLLHRIVEPDSVVKEPDTPELMDSEDSDSELYSKNTTHLNILHVECSDTDNESDQKRTKFPSWD